MFKISPKSVTSLTDYVPEAPHDQGTLLEGRAAPTRPQLVSDFLVLHTPARNLGIAANAGGGTTPLALFDHLPRQYRFNPVIVESTFPSAPQHAPFAAALGAVAGLATRGAAAADPRLGAHLSVLSGLTGRAHAVAAAFFRRGDAPGTADRVPVVVRDSLPVAGNTTMVVASEGSWLGSYPLMEKAYAQFLRGDERAPAWEPHAATFPEDTSTAKSTAHALFSLTGCEPLTRTVLASDPASKRTEHLVRLGQHVAQPGQAAVIILHAPSEQPEGPENFEEPVPGRQVGDHRLLAGMPLAVLFADHQGLTVFDPLRVHPHLYAVPTLQQVLDEAEVPTWEQVYTPEFAQEKIDALDFPQRLAEALPAGSPYLILSPEKLVGLSYTTLELPALSPQAQTHRTLATLEGASLLLRHDRVFGASHDAQQRAASLLERGKWSVGGKSLAPTGTLTLNGAPVLTVTRDPESRMFRKEAGETPRPLVDHLLELPAALSEDSL